jgi:transcriptional regulator with XRE-family HTH domain
MEHEEYGEARWPIDLEATVGKNVRRLREGRDLSQQQLGADLALLGIGMHQTTVAKLEAGSKPLRLNEVAAIAAYFEVPIEWLWETTTEMLDEREEATRQQEIRTVMDALTVARTEVERASAQVSDARKAHDTATALRLFTKAREASLAARLRALETPPHVEH